MESQGFTAEDFDQSVEVWPENWPAWCLWTQVRNQWRIGMGGAFAIDYGPLFTLMDRLRLDDDSWQAMFDAIRVIESAALTAMKD